MSENFSDFLPGDMPSFGSSMGSVMERWLSEDVVPDPEPLPRLPGWNILIRPVDPCKKASKNLILPQTVTEDIKYLTNVGRVLKLGELCYNEQSKLGDKPWCKVGDLVVIPKFCGAKLNYKGVKLTLIDEKDVLMVLDDAEDIDPTFNISKNSA